MVASIVCIVYWISVTDDCWVSNIHLVTTLVDGCLI